MKEDWIHLELYFKNYDQISKDLLPQYESTNIYKELISYLKAVVESLSELINRYFYLFEDNPNLFLALEVNDIDKIEVIKNRILAIKQPALIKSSTIKLSSGDGNHPGAVIDFFHISTKYAFFRISQEYRPGYYNHDETKLIHCFCNQLFITWDNEKIFYLKGLFLRGFPLDSIVKVLQNLNFPKEKIIEFLTFDFAKEHR